LLLTRFNRRLSDQENGCRSRAPFLQANGLTRPRVVNPGQAGTPAPPWVRRPRERSQPEGLGLIPDITFVPFEFVFAKKITKFILKRPNTMMLGLAGEIFLDVR